MLMVLNGLRASQAKYRLRIKQLMAVMQHSGFWSVAKIKPPRMPYGSLTASTLAVTAAAIAPRYPVVGLISEVMIASSPIDQSFASPDVHEARRSGAGARNVSSFGTNLTPFECTVVALKKESRFYVFAGGANPFD